MKQLTEEPGVSRMTTGFRFALRRPEARRRFLNNLKPEPTGLPLDLDEWEIVADLDPGMVDWQEVRIAEQ
jgi:hypothetical protein